MRRQRMARTLAHTCSAVSAQKADQMSGSRPCAARMKAIPRTMPTSVTAVSCRPAGGMRLACCGRWAPSIRPCCLARRKEQPGRV